MHYHPRTQINSYYSRLRGDGLITKHCFIKKTFVILFIYSNHLNKPGFLNQKIFQYCLINLYLFQVGKNKGQFSFDCKRIGQGIVSEVLKHKNTQPSYIFSRENTQNSEPQNGPRRGLDFIALGKTKVSFSLIAKGLGRV